MVGCGGMWLRKMPQMKTQGHHEQQHHEQGHLLPGHREHQEYQGTPRNTRNLRIRRRVICCNRNNIINVSGSINITTNTIFGSIRVVILTFIRFPWISFCSPGIINNAIIVFSNPGNICRRSIHTKLQNIAWTVKNKSYQRIKAHNKIKAAPAFMGGSPPPFTFQVAFGPQIVGL